MTSAVLGHMTIETAVQSGPPVEPALAAYESLAPFYDRFTKDSKYEPVLDAVESWARAQGLKGDCWGMPSRLYDQRAQSGDEMGSL